MSKQTSSLSDLFVAGFYMEGSRATIIAALQAATKGDAKEQDAIRAEVRRGVFTRRFGHEFKRDGMPSIACINAVDVILSKVPSALTEDEKTVHAAFRKNWSRLLEAAGVDSVDPRAAGNKGKNTGKVKAPGEKAKATTTQDATVSGPAPIVAAPLAKTLADVEAYCLQQATSYHHYVNKNATAFTGAKGKAFAEALRQFTRAARAAALIKED